MITENCVNDPWELAIVMEDMQFEMLFHTVNMISTYLKSFNLNIISNIVKNEKEYIAFTVSTIYDQKLWGFEIGMFVWKPEENSLSNEVWNNAI